MCMPCMRTRRAVVGCEHKIRQRGASHPSRKRTLTLLQPAPLAFSFSFLLVLRCDMSSRASTVSQTTSWPPQTASIFPAGRGGRWSASQGFHSIDSVLKIRPLIDVVVLRDAVYTSPPQGTVASTGLLRGLPGREVNRMSTHRDRWPAEREYQTACRKN